MKVNLKIEQLAITLLSIYFFSELEYAWWLLPLLWILPDLGMIGYLINNKIGALTYNLTHNQALGIALFIIGKTQNIDELILASAILLLHSSMDRLLGYGLKYKTDFKDTHLQRV